MTPPRSAARYHHGDLRRELMRHAHQLLNEKGADELSLRDLARAAGVSQSAPFRHFENKGALLRELAEDGFAELEEKMKAAAAASPDATSGLQALGSAYLEIAATRPHFFRMMFSADLGPSRVHEGIYRACDRVYGRLRALLVEGQEQGAFRAGDPDEQSLLVWSLMHGYSMLCIDGRLDDLHLSDDGLKQLLHKMLSVVFAGLK